MYEEAKQEKREKLKKTAVRIPARLLTFAKKPKPLFTVPVLCRQGKQEETKAVHS